MESTKEQTPNIASWEGTTDIRLIRVGIFFIQKYYTVRICGLRLCVVMWLTTVVVFSFSRCSRPESKHSWISSTRILTIWRSWKRTWSKSSATRSRLDQPASYTPSKYYNNQNDTGFFVKFQLNLFKNYMY